MSRPGTDEAFLELAEDWTSGQVEHLIALLWSGYERLKNSNTRFASASLERSITETLERRIRDLMTGFEPFSVQHGTFEYETMAAPPAQPPAYDLAFVFRADEKLKWPVEAKVLETPDATNDYVSDIRTQYETCRYGPFSDSGAMLGYLLAGATNDVFVSVEKKLGKKLVLVEGLEHQAHRYSDHDRSVPQGKTYPKRFRCHHLIFEFTGVRRSTAAKRPAKKR